MNNKRLEDQIKELIVKQLELKVEPGSIKDDDILFGAGLGLDSIDSMAIIAGIDEEFNIEMSDEDLLEPDKVFTSVKTIADFIRSKE